MGSQTTTHVSSKLDTVALYCDLRLAVMKYVALVGATTSTTSSTAMDIGAIGNFGEEDSEGSWSQNDDYWGAEERSEEGSEEALSSMKGKGEGPKGGRCSNYLRCEFC